MREQEQNLSVRSPQQGDHGHLYVGAESQTKSRKGKVKKDFQREQDLYSETLPPPNMNRAFPPLT